MKWNIRQDQFAVITQNAPLTLSGPNPPDLMRLPPISGLVKDHLLKNLDGYFKAVRLEQVPGLAACAASHAGPSGGPRGAGSLWAMGVNYSLTGVFYNKTLAAKIGMTSAPTDAGRARRAPGEGEGGGHHADRAVQRRRDRRPAVPAPAADGGVRAAGPDQRLDLRQAGRDHRHAVEPRRRRRICSSGSRPATSTRTPTRPTTAAMMSKFEHGDGLLIFDGDWESGNFDKLMPGKVGFFLMPPLKAGGKHAAMSAPLTYGIAAKAKHADCAAFFLNWVATNPTARKINVAVGGSNPGGPPSLSIPAVKPGSMTAQTLAAGKVDRQGERRHGLHRQRDGCDLRPGVDA